MYMYLKLFFSSENAQTPYSAIVMISNVEYGQGFASSKKAAKMEAAKATLAILIPELNTEDDDMKIDLQDLSVSRKYVST